MELKKWQTRLSDVYTHRAYQLLATLDTKSKTTLASFVRSANIIYAWIKDKFDSLGIPEEMQSYTRDYADRFVGVIYNKEKKFFSMITRHSDETVAGRMWITEAEIAYIKDELKITIRNSYTTVKTHQSDEISSPPAFVYRLINSIGLCDVALLSRQPRCINSQDDLLDLFDLVSSTKRRFPVIVVSQVDKSDYGFLLPDYLFDAGKLQNGLLAYAHIVQLPQEFTYKWTELVGKNWTVYDGAVRMYYPSLDFCASEYYNHPLWVKERILASYRQDHISGNIITEGAAFIHALTETVKFRNCHEQIIWKDHGLKGYYVANREILEEKRDRGASSAEDYIEEIEQLRQDVDAHEAYLNLLENETLAKDDEISRLRDQLRRLQSYNETLKYQIDDLKGYDSDEDIPLPDDYDNMCDWVETHLSGRLILHSRARRALKEAEYEDVTQVYKALLLLATVYRNMRRGASTQEEFNKACEALLLKEEASITPTGAGMFGDTYFVRHKDKNMFIGRHLVSRSSREPRFCLRVYFFWDEEEGVVVVGSLPGHLENRCS